MESDSSNGPFGLFTHEIDSRVRYFALRVFKSFIKLYSSVDNAASNPCKLCSLLTSLIDDLKKYLG